jgi:hypothetical protein
VEGRLLNVSDETRQVAFVGVAFPWSIGAPYARRITVRPNLTAQCKQMGKFCQGKNNDKAQNLPFIVPKLSIPSGIVADSPKMGNVAPRLKQLPGMSVDTITQNVGATKKHT